jgi:glycosyltransferase involved in cell wall biosynthesis
VDQTREEFDFHGSIRVESRPNKRLGQRLAWLTNPRYMNVHGCVANTSDRARLLERLPEFDALWLQNSRTANILQQWHWARSVLDIDDIPSTFHRSLRQSESRRVSRWKAGLHVRLARRREALWKQRFSTLVVCSAADREYLGGGPQIHVVPNGFARPAQEPVRSPVSPPRIGFIGLFSYMPNVEGVRWFVRECWPEIKKQIPDARLRLVGKDTDSDLKPDGADIDALGWVSDPAKEIASWSAMIIPVRHGAGTRVKIADAFSRKCPVVSTSLGAYGYDVTDGRELRLADTARDFAAACVSMVREPGPANELAERAWKKFLQLWTWESITPNVASAVQHAIGGTRFASPPLSTANPVLSK